MSPFAASIVGLLAWGAFAFGGVLPWGYWPLVAGAALLGGWGAIRGVKAGRPVLRNGLWVPILAVVFAGALQLLPLPAAVVERISPARHTFTRDAINERAAAISIHPGRTVRAVVFVALFGVFFIGVRAGLDDRDVRAVALGIAVVGLSLAAVGLLWRPMVPKSVEELSDGSYIERASTPDEAMDTSHSDTFGPFGNRNHFAGWMVMAGPLAMGWLYARLQSTAGRWSNVTWQTSIQRAFRSDWLLGPASFATLVMALSVFVTQSRSGIACLVGGLLLMAGLVARKHSPGLRGFASAAAACLIAVTVLALSSGALSAALTRYAELEGTGWGGRLPIWRDALGIARDFPLTGTGLSTYEDASEQYRTTPFGQEAAHNDYLELATSGGLMVALPALVLASRFIREVRQRFTHEGHALAIFWLRVGAVVGLGAIAAQELVDFSLQIPANIALFVVLCAIAARESTERPAVGVRGATP